MTAENARISAHGPDERLSARSVENHDFGRPPVPKYRLVVQIDGNSHEEIERELLVLTRGGYLLDSEYHQRDEFHVVGGRVTVELVHRNSEMTPERYDAELDAWWQARKEARRAE